MSIVNSQTAAFTNEVFNSGSIRDMMDVIMVPHQEAMPTWKILLAFKQTGSLNPNEKFEIPIKTKDVSPSISTKHDTYPLENIDNITTQEWGVVKMKSGGGTSDDDIAHFANEKAYFNHIDILVDSIHEGFTKVMNFLPFWDWTASDISSEEIDVSTLLANQSLPPEELSIKAVTSVNDLPFSLPMAARNSDTGHTYGNIAVTDTTNNFWRPVVTDATGATVTRNTTAYDADTNPQTDVVESVTGAIPLDLSQLDEHLGQVQEGKQYALLAPVGRKLYRQLRDIVLAMNIRDHQSPIADLGIRSAITWEEYNVTFYLEPKMTALWPSSIFFFDPEVFYLKTDIVMDPTGGTGMYPWDRISGTTTWGTMIRMIYQYVCSDRRGVSAMHGFTSDS
jgi:hypothetical protein